MVDILINKNFSTFNERRGELLVTTIANILAIDASLIFLQKVLLDGVTLQMPKEKAEDLIKMFDSPKSNEAFQLLLKEFHISAITESEVPTAPTFTPTNNGSGRTLDEIKKTIQGWPGTEILNVNDKSKIR